MIIEQNLLIRNFRNVKEAEDTVNQLLKDSDGLYGFMEKCVSDEPSANSLETYAKILICGNGEELIPLKLIFDKSETSDSRKANVLASKICIFFREYNSLYAVHKGEQFLHVHIFLKRCPETNAQPFDLMSKATNDMLNFAIDELDSCKVFSADFIETLETWNDFLEEEYTYDI